MASVVANAINHIGQEKASRNKRKFRADTPLLDLNKSVSSSQNDCPTYEFSAEKFDLPHIDGHACACDMCTSVSQDYSDGFKIGLGFSNALGPVKASGATEADEFHDADWSDLTETQLEELVLKNLDTIFKSAIKKIVAYGYTEEVATKAVLRSGLCCYGCKDTVSNIVDNTLSVIRDVQGTCDSSREHCFEDLEQLEKYILAELVCVLRAVRPVFSTGDAMWCLLICDMNVSHACAMNSEPLGSFVDEVAQQPKSDAKCSNIPKPCKPAPPIQCTHCTHPEIPSKLYVPNLTKGKNSIVFSGLVSQKGGSNSTHEVKFVTSRKVHSISSKRYSILRQKSLYLEKSYRTYCCKGSSSRAGKLGGLSGLILDKKLKSVADTACINLESATLSINRETRVDSPQDSRHPSTKVLLPKTNTFSELRSDDIQPALSLTDSELSLSLPATCITAPVPVDDNAHEKTMEKWVPHNNEDEMILKLSPRIKELQNQLHEWTEWANQKVMQAARRLSKDKVELKMLRQEKEEVERLQREKQALEDNTMKKLSEMGKALGKASGQVERANGSVRRLQVENSALRHAMEGAKLQAAEATINCQEVSKREKNTLMKLQSWEKQKTFLKGELACEKLKLAQLQQKLGHANDVYAQTEAKWKLEEKAKEELLAEAASIIKEKEQIEASSKSTEDAIKAKAQNSLNKYKDDIQKLEKEISRLRVKFDSSKIAALRSGSINGSYRIRNTPTQTEQAFHTPYVSKIMGDFDKNDNGGVKRDRECVMCLSEEMSVVFLPCAHQVVCKTCNDLHEKQGMKDCPSCRSHIQRRVSVRYARS